MSDTPETGPAGRAGRQSAQARLSALLLESLVALAAAGEVDRACRLAGQACMALRNDDPAASRRFDVLLHRLTPKLDGPST